MNNVKYWATFSQLGLGYRTVKQLLTALGSLEAIWQADRQQLLAAGASAALADKLEVGRQRLRSGQYHERVDGRFEIVSIEDSRYPTLLREIHSPPLVLYVRGDLTALANRCLTVVGTRIPSPYGLRATHTITQPIAAEGVTIVSGLAFGIDAAAHQAALAAKGTTVAVLGSGVDLITPFGNADLGRRILEASGTIISEYPPGTKPERHHFPQRNRIIAGLSRATVIVEAGVKSGALLTARFALEENRDLFAVPGPIDAPTSAGPNNLLKLGASPVTGADDLREVLGLDRHAPLPNTIELRADNAAEATLLRLLAEPRHIDELVAISTLETSVVNATLSLLEMKGRVRHLGGMNYTRVS
ncbi:MAG: DNA-protecting protein DprA [Candidatus Kerfeldbacteria bacterium]|nr:DNA-protecting protein DprA [Candidatus Kerfeldbacteria bacterium]